MEYDYAEQERWLELVRQHPDTYASTSAPTTTTTTSATSDTCSVYTSHHLRRLTVYATAALCKLWCRVVSVPQHTPPLPLVDGATQPHNSAAAEPRDSTSQSPQSLSQVLVTRGVMGMADPGGLPHHGDGPEEDEQHLKRCRLALDTLAQLGNINAHIVSWLFRWYRPHIDCMYYIVIHKYICITNFAIMYRNTIYLYYQ